MLTEDMGGIPKPRNSLVLIMREAKKDRTEAGIHIPTGGLGEFDIATVLALGPGTPSDTAGRMDDLSDLEVGMRVVVKTANARIVQGQIPGTRSRQTAPTTLPFRIDGEEVEVISQFDILMILNS